jgi:Fe-S-cluster containining protein
MDFNCINDCAQCCIEREYYPSKRFGKVGVLILPEEKDKVESLAKNENIKISILPRIGISNENSGKPDKILAYQLMGKESNGNTCPFLDTETSKRSPHGGFLCKIYQNRPLACSAYPVIDSNPITLDQKCKFCQEHKTADSNLNSEIESLLKIKTKMDTDAPHVWRYATGVGEDDDSEIIESGWILEI